VFSFLTNIFKFN